MQVNKELSHLKAQFLEGKAPQASSVRHSGFLPFTLGVNVGWIVSLLLWKLCVKQAEKSGQTVSEWIGQKIFPTESVQRKVNDFVPQPLKTAETAEAVSEELPVVSVLKGAKSSAKTKKTSVKKVPAKKTKSSSKKSVAKKATKAEEKKSKETASQKKTVKRAAKAEKTAKKSTAASKAKKKVQNSEDKA